MTEQVEQWICITFSMKLEHSSMWELFGWIRRLQLWTPGDWQLHQGNVPAHASRLMQTFLVKHQILQVTKPPYSPDLAPCNFWLFPKLKSLLKRKRFQTIDEIQEDTRVQLMAIGRTEWGVEGAYFEGDWGIIVLCTIFLVSCILFNKCLEFLYYIAGYFLDRPRIALNLRIRRDINK